jgi:hypothetical protein
MGPIENLLLLFFFQKISKIASQKIWSEGQGCDQERHWRVYKNLEISKKFITKIINFNFNNQFKKTKYLSKAL